MNDLKTFPDGRRHGGPLFLDFDPVLPWWPGGTGRRDAHAPDGTARPSPDETNPPPPRDDPRDGAAPPAPDRREPYDHDPFHHQHR
jgi:hypothetical protein